LLVPEIVELEVEKIWRELTSNITRSIAALESDIEQVMKKKVWNEIEDVKKQVMELLQNAKHKKKASAEEFYKQIVEVFNLPQVKRLPLTPDLMFLARKRLIAGRMPDCSNQASNDACIVESLSSHFTSTSEYDQLYFCSENNGDFALKTDEGLVLHPLLSAGMPSTKYLSTLQEMIEFFESKAQIAEPPKEVIEKALDETATVPEAAPPAGICAVPGCGDDLWWLGPYCKLHYDMHLNAMTPKRRDQYNAAVNRLLNTLSYREREVFKLRAGIGDGFAYTREEVAHIFKETVRRVAQLDRQIVNKLRQPNRYTYISPYFGT